MTTDMHRGWLSHNAERIVLLTVFLVPAGCMSLLPVPATQCKSGSDCTAPRQCVESTCQDPTGSSSSAGGATSGALEAGSSGASSAGTSVLSISQAPSSRETTSSFGMPSSSATTGSSLLAPSSSFSGSGGGINGACGTARDALVTVSATDGEPGSALTLCSAGPGVQTPPTPIVNPGVSYAWTCPGSGQGTRASCQSYLGWDVTLTAGANGTLTCTRENPPSGATTTIMVAASTSSARKVWHNHSLTCTATPSVGYAASLSANGPGCGNASGGTVGPIVGTGACTISATFTQVETTTCPGLPVNWFLLGALPGFANSGTNVTPVGANTGRSYSFTLDAAALAQYPNGWFLSDTGGSGSAYSVSACPGPLKDVAGNPFAPAVLGQDDEGMVDANGDGRPDSCTSVGYYYRYRINGAYYANTANLQSQVTCFLPTTDASGNPVTYYLNIYSYTDGALQETLIVQ